MKNNILINKTIDELLKEYHFLEETFEENLIDMSDKTVSLGEALDKINEFDLKEEGLTESQLTDKARKIKNQVADLEAEIVKLENNLGFFGKVSRDNPLLKDTFDKIDDKKAQLEMLKQSLHHIISGE